MEHIRAISVIDQIPLNRIQDGGQKAPLPTSFLPVTSTNAGISPQNFLTFLLHKCKITMSYLM